MSESSEARTRRRWITFGELVAVLALVISAAGVWVSWQGSSKKDDGPTRIVEQKQAVPLVLRGKVEDGGKRIEISPLESSHALESVRMELPGGSTVDLGSDGVLGAGDVEGALKARDKELKGSHSVPVRVTAHYVEQGAEKTATRSYQLRYRWEGGGLFEGHSVRLTGLSRG